MDYTGKSGVGKRYLDENGNFKPITSLPKEVQKEIAENSRKANKMLMEKRLSSSGVDPKRVNNDEMSKKMLAIIEAQAATIERLDAKLNSDPNEVVEVVDDEPKLTPKEELLAEAMDLGLKVNEKMTMKTIQKLIDEHDQEVIPADSDLYPDVDEDNDL